MINLTTPVNKTRKVAAIVAVALGTTTVGTAAYAAPEEEPKRTSMVIPPRPAKDVDPPKVGPLISPQPKADEEPEEETKTEEPKEESAVGSPVDPATPVEEVPAPVPEAPVPTEVPAPGLGPQELPSAPPEPVPVPEQPAPAPPPAPSVPLDDNIIVNSFGYRYGVNPLLPASTPELHNGIDFSGDLGDPVRSIKPGTVVYAEYHQYGGNRVEIDHGDGSLSTYSHLNESFVQVGQHVEGGQHIGDVGTTGNSTGPHLHFEYAEFGVDVDPQPRFGF